MLTAIKKFLSGFVFAWKGIAAVITSERNMRVHLAAAGLVIAAGFYFGITIMEWCLVIGSIGMVMAAECFNTAIEWLTDLAKPEFHPLAGKIKDVAAGAVLLAAITATAIGALIFVKYLFPA